MFDAHILFYAYNNLEDDDFGVGYLGNKQEWVERINRWNRNDNIDTEYTIEEWDELDCESDFRGCQLAEIEPDENGGYIVTYVDKNDEIVLHFDKSWKIVEDSLTQKVPSVPKWTARLKNTMKNKDN